MSTTSTGDECIVIEQWLFERLTSDAALIDSLQISGSPARAPEDMVFAYNVPEDKNAPPYVLYSQENVLDVVGVGAARIMVNAVYVVRVVGEGRSFKQFKPSADRIDALLHDVHNQPVTGMGTVVSSVRDHPVHYPEADSGRLFVHLGGAYRVLAQGGL